MDIAGAYPEAAGVRQYRRLVQLDKGQGVTIADSHDGALPAELSLMVSQAPEISEGRIGLGDLASIDISGAGTLRAEAISITDPRLREAWPDTIHRILVPIAGRELHLTIT